MKQIEFICALVIAVCGTFGLLIFIGYVALWLYYPIAALIFTLVIIVVMIVVAYHRLKKESKQKSQ